MAFKKGQFHHSKKSKIAIGLGQKGKPKSKVWIEKMKEIRKNKPFGFKKGNQFGKKNKGIPRFFGKDHPNWKGGISFEPYPISWTKLLKKAIRKRDKYKCKLCKRRGIRLDIHHIDYDKKNCNPNNLITLCVSCHMKTNYNRNNWHVYFTTKRIWR